MLFCLLSNKFRKNYRAVDVILNSIKKFKDFLCIKEAA